MVVKATNIMERIDNIIKTNGGYIRNQDLISRGIPTIYLSRYVKKNHLAKVAPGFYAKADWPIDVYFVLQSSYPRFIYSFSSSIYLHGLGDILPSFFEVTGPKNYRPMKEKRDDIIQHTDTRDEIYSLGITTIRTVFGNKVVVYDLEKTICDLIRFRKHIDSEVFIKAIRSYSKRSDKDLNRLYRYSTIMGIEGKVASIMEIFVNED